MTCLEGMLPWTVMRSTLLDLTGRSVHGSLDGLEGMVSRAAVVCKLCQLICQHVWPQRVTCDPCWHGVDFPGDHGANHKTDRSMVTQMEIRSLNSMMYVCRGMHVMQARWRHGGVDAVQARVGVVGAINGRSVGEVLLVDFGEAAHMDLEVVMGRVPAKFAEQGAVSVELVCVGVPVPGEVNHVVWVILEGAVNACEGGSTGGRAEAGFDVNCTDANPASGALEKQDRDTAGNDFDEMLHAGVKQFVEGAVHDEADTTGNRIVRDVTPIGNV